MIFIVMAKIFLTENQLTDLIKGAVEKITGTNTKDSSMKDIFKDFGVETPSIFGDIFKGKKETDFKSFKGKTKIGKVKLIGGFTGEQKRNIDLIIKAMESKGIKDPYAQIGILSVIGKESGFTPKSEIDYSTTPNSRIRNIFGKRVPKDDTKLDRLKKNPKKFFDIVYGGRFGNDSDEGYKYRGRGFNQLTFKGNYQKYGSMSGVDIVSNPDRLNDPDVAAKVALAFFTKGKSASSFPNFNDKEDAAIYFADINAGGGAGGHRQKAIDYSKKFEVA
jgi:putative chitinase